MKEKLLRKVVLLFFLSSSLMKDQVFSLNEKGVKDVVRGQKVLTAFEGKYNLAFT